MTLSSVSEPGEGGGPTVRVNVLSDPRVAGAVLVDGVFGIDPDDLDPYQPATRDELIALARLAAGD